MSLPWKPIADLPESPAAGVFFLFHSPTWSVDGKPAIATYRSGRWRFSAQAVLRTKVLHIFTHFIEVTPP